MNKHVDADALLTALYEADAISARGAKIIREFPAVEKAANVMAEEQGLLVRLPCKVGDMVYYRRGRDIIGDTADRIIIDGIDNQVLVGAHEAYMFCDFGRNVFLTREEAEAALKGGQDDV